MDSHKQFSDEFLDQVRDASDLADLVGRTVRLKRTGSDYIGLCPFHDDKKPSFRVNVGQQRFRCWACGEQGDAFAWTMRTGYVSFPEAVRSLATQAGISLPAPTERSNEDIERKRRQAKCYGALSDSQRLYVKGLKKAPDVLAYLRDTRGLTDETIETFGIGAVRSGVVPYLTQREDQETLLAAGVIGIREDGSVYERFRYRVMFPIRNERGSIVGFGGRTYFERNNDAPKYLNSPETDLFQKHRELYGLDLARRHIGQDSLAIVVEGYLDVVSLHQAGERRAVAPLGTAIGDRQVRRLFGYADEVCFVFDGDAAGRRAALAAARTVLGEIPDGKQASFVFLADGEDPDSLVRQAGFATWESMVASRVPLSSVLTRFVAGRLPLDVPENLVRAHQRGKDVLDAIKRAHVFKRALHQSLEERLGLAL